MSDHDKSAALDATFDDVVGELGAAVKPAEPEATADDKLRARVFERIDESIAAKSGLVTVRADEDALWVDAGPEAKKKTLRIDKSAGIELCLLRMAPGSSVGEHSHPVDELVFVLEGDLTIDDIEMSVGDFHFAPKGSTHHSVSTVNGVLMLLQIPAY